LEELGTTSRSSDRHDGKKRGTRRCDPDSVARNQKRSDDQSLRQAVDDERSHENRRRPSQLQPFRDGQRGPVDQGVEGQNGNDDARSKPLVFRRLLHQPEDAVAHRDERDSRTSEPTPELRQHACSKERRHDAKDEAVDTKT
jgi:hypothetical protein